MRTLVAGCLVFLTLLFSNAWVFDFCRSEAPDLPECCRDGFCPHPHHAVVLTDAHNTDCTCRSRDAESMALTLSAPAIVPDLFYGHVVQVSVLEHDFRTAAVGFDYSPPEIGRASCRERV